MSAETPRKEMLLQTMLISSLSKYLTEKLQQEEGGG